jgi:zinc/manganese transport system substrate-binding protein
MKNLKYTVRTTSLLIAGAIILLAFSATAKSSNKIKVVATFSILGDMVKRIGGDHVHLTTLVGPNGDTHVYQPTPTAAKAMSEANVLIVNGLGFEGWLDRLVEASDFDGKRVIATLGIKAIAHEEGDDHDKQHAEDKHEDGHAGHDHGTFDPHAWQSVANAAIYVNNITASLSQVAPDKASTFYQNRAAYMAEINGLHNQILAMVARLPQNRRTVVTSHDAFQYFGRDYGLTFLAPQGLSTESEASAQDVAALIEQMRTKHIKAVFIENITDPRLLKQIANETGAIVGGTLYPGALSEQNGPAPTYLKMMHHNATTLIRALGS